MKTLLVSLFGFFLILLYRDIQTLEINTWTFFWFLLVAYSVTLLLFFDPDKEALMETYKFLLKNSCISSWDVNHGIFKIEGSLSKKMLTQVETDSMSHEVTLYGYNKNGGFKEIKGSVHVRRKTILFDDYKTGYDIRDQKDYLFIVACHAYTPRELQSYNTKEQSAYYSTDTSRTRKVFRIYSALG